MALNQYCTTTQKTTSSLMRAFLGETHVKFQVLRWWHIKVFDLHATNINVTLYNSQLFTHGIVGLNDVSKLSFSFENSHET